MISQRDNQGINTNGGFTAVLELLCLSQEEERAALEFLEGRTGEEALAGFTFQDLSDVPDEPVLKLFTELFRRKKTNEVKRLFLLLFARGQATCYRMLPVQFYGQEEFYGVDAVKRTAVYGAAIGQGVYRAVVGQGVHYPSVHSLNRLLEFADHQPDTLRRALEYEKNKFINGKLVLLAMCLIFPRGADGGGRRLCLRDKSHFEFVFLRSADGRKMQQPRGDGGSGRLSRAGRDDVRKAEQQMQHKACRGRYADACPL